MAGSPFSKLCTLLPGGVNSPARSFVGLDMQPLVVEGAQAAELIDHEGARFVDYCGSWGAAILGHSPPEMVEAVRSQLSLGTSFGFTSVLEGRLAERIQKHVPSMERLRLLSSGTEATMTAVRLARAFTGRDLVIKFNGNYHGHSDVFLVQAGSGAAWLGPTASSKGVPVGVVASVHSLPYNDCAVVRDFFRLRGEQVAAVIVEPIAGNMGVVPATPEFLQMLRSLTYECGALLIFDEIITGFRVGLSGAQGLYGVTPDLTCLGKVIGGGFPLAACGGRADILEQMAPLGPVYQAGTLSGNAIAVCAGLATLEALEADGVYSQLQRKTDRLCQPIEAYIQAKGLNACVQRIGSMWTLFLGRRAVSNMEESYCTHFEAFRQLFRSLFQMKIILPPSPYEAAFIGRAHSEQQLDDTASKIMEALGEIGGQIS